MVVLLAVAVLAAPAVSGAGRSSSTSLQAQNAAIAAKSRSAILGLYSLDQQLATAQAHLTTLQAQLSGLRAQQATLRIATAVALRTTTVAQGRLARRLQLLYERGDVDSLEILFGARNLDEALNSIESLKGVTKQDTQVLDEATGARQTFLRDRATLGLRTDEVAAAVEDAAHTAASLQQTVAQRHAYIASLAAQRRLNDSQIAVLVARAQAAQARSAQLTRANASPASFTAVAPAISPAVVPSTTLASASAGRTLTVVTTGYALGGTTSTGLPVGWGVAAVDPSVIPLGTHMSVPGYGEAVAADTGGAVVGNTIDLWFPSVAQANAWGRRVVTITLH